MAEADNMGSATSGSSSITIRYDFEKWKHAHEVPTKFSNEPRNMLESFLCMRQDKVNCQDHNDYTDCLKQYSSDTDITSETVAKLIHEIRQAGIPSINEEVLGDALNLEKLSVEDRSVGVLLGVMIGDCLGAPVEGYPYHDILRRYPSGVVNLYPGTQMGIREKGIKYAEYSDDTNSTLALAQSLVHRKAINGPEIAVAYAQFWEKNGKGYPDSAQSTMKRLLNGADYRITCSYYGRKNLNTYLLPSENRLDMRCKTGTSQFADGSYANGGAMRISPIGIVGRDLKPEDLRPIVEEAIRSTHVHPESIDGALIIALMISYCYKRKAEDIDRKEIFDLILENVQSSGMKAILGKLQQSILENCPTEAGIANEDLNKLDALGLLRFQIRSTEAVPLVVYCFLRWYENPCQCLINTVNLGGDADTTAGMVGGILGALHGTEWIPHRFFDPLENGDNGRDYLIGLALALAEGITMPN